MKRRAQEPLDVVEEKKKLKVEEKKKLEEEEEDDVEKLKTTLITRNIDLWHEPELLEQYTSTEHVEVHPVVNTDEQVTFSIPRTQKAFIEPRFDLKITWGIKNGDKKTANADNVAPVCIVVYLCDDICLQHTYLDINGSIANVA